MWLAIIGSLFGFACVFAPSIAGAAMAAPSVASPAVQRAIESAVEKDRKLYGGRTPVPGVLIGVWDGQGANYVRTFGYADLAKRVPLTTADHFRIGSNTKTFVAAVILQLVDEHKLSLDDPLSRFNLGVTVPNAQNITIRELANMRSGLFESYDTPQFDRMTITGDTRFDPRTLIGWAVQQKPYFAPNQGYHYSNTNYLILGLVIESVTHDSVGDQIRKRFLVPFRLTQTSYPATQAMPEPWAHGYGLDKRRNWEDVSGTIPVSLMGAAGQMISDMADMKRWITLYVTGKTSSPAMHRALMDCVSTGAPGQGFGLALGCSSGWYGYTGGLPGYNTANFFFPQTGATIVAWVDVQASDPKPGVANAIFRDIARILTPNNVPLPGGAKGL
jgi:D-alanyl-D-alanine carboxypeptidase